MTDRNCSIDVDLELARAAEVLLIKGADSIDIEVQLALDFPFANPETISRTVATLIITAASNRDRWHSYTQAAADLEPSTYRYRSEARRPQNRYRARSIKYKTRLCKGFSNGTCTALDAACLFAHGTSDLHWICPDCNTNNQASDSCECGNTRTFLYPSSDANRETAAGLERAEFHPSLFDIDVDLGDGYGHMYDQKDLELPHAAAESLGASASEDCESADEEAGAETGDRGICPNLQRDRWCHFWRHVKMKRKEASAEDRHACSKSHPPKLLRCPDLEREQSDGTKGCNRRRCPYQHPNPLNRDHERAWSTYDPARYGQEMEDKAKKPQNCFYMCPVDDMLPSPCRAFETAGSCPDVGCRHQHLPRKADMRAAIEIQTQDSRKARPQLIACSEPICACVRRIWTVQSTSGAGSSSTSTSTSIPAQLSFPLMRGPVSANAGPSSIPRLGRLLGGGFPAAPRPVTSTAAGPQFAKVEQIKNTVLAAAFEKRKAELAKSLGHTPSEIYGFHGTPSANVQSIVQAGFSAAHQINNAFGKGTYFARDPHVAMGYARGGKHIFLCHVLVEGTDCRYEPTHRYYIIPNTAGCLPVYLITLA